MDIYNIKEYVKQLDPVRNAVVVDLIDGNYVVSIECKDLNALNKLRWLAQKIVKELE